MANNFSEDSNCVALYKFESSALVTDSIGGNTLTLDSTGGVEVPEADLVKYKEGSASIEFEGANTEWCEIADANLDVGFPFKSGSGVVISFCTWLYLDTRINGIFYEIIHKGYPDQMSFSLQINDGGHVSFLATYNGTTYNTAVHQSVLQAGRWYHIGVVYDGGTEAMLIRIWDDTVGAIHGVDYTANLGNTGFAATGEITFGCYKSFQYDVNPLTGNLDEFVIFKDILTADEIDEIRIGNYGFLPPVIAGIAARPIKRFVDLEIRKNG